MINENDLQKYVDEANNKSQDAGTKNLEKRMKREVMRAIADFNMIEE
jgi:hypothetical protein